MVILIEFFEGRAAAAKAGGAKLPGSAEKFLIKFERGGMSGVSFIG